MSKDDTGLNIFITCFHCHRYAFITYGNKSEAEAAKEAMNGQTVCGQEIKVEILMLLRIIRMTDRDLQLISNDLVKG